MPDYGETEELLTTRRSESIQPGHEAVYGFDERAGESEPDYFPMNELMAFAAQNDQSWIIDRPLADLQSEMALIQVRLPEQSVAESMFLHNDGDRVASELAN
ncbi:MAG: hypothetical protein WBA68_00875 [Alteraurantiacibacter sp.]